jgi:hypothetical protein
MHEETGNHHGPQPPVLYSGTHHLTDCSHILGRIKVEIFMSLSFRRGERRFQRTMLPLSLPPIMKKAWVETRLDGIRNALGTPEAQAWQGPLYSESGDSSHHSLPATGP